MKILHLISGLGMGGAENTLYNLIKSDSNNNHIIVSLSNPIYFEKKFKKINIKVINLNFKSSILNNIFKLISFIKKNKPNLIQSWMYHAEFLSIIIKIFTFKKIIWNIRNSTPFSRSFKLITRILIFINAFSSHFIPHRIVSCSKEATKNHINIGYCKNKIVYIPNGVDLKKFNIKPKKKSLKKITIGCVARFSAQKDHMNLIKALSIIKNKGYKNWQCYFAGKNVDNKNVYLKNILKNLKLQKYCKLYGPIKKIEKFYNYLDFLVLPSKDGEGFPNVVLEAYASGIPCISTNVGDVKEIINNKKYIIERKNAQILSNIILKMFNDKNTLSKNNRANLRKLVKKKYSIDKMVFSYNYQWKKICNV
jgi:glycosyltransferase involved in cell wall biosynthesis